MNKDYTEKEVHQTYCSNCCNIFSYVVEAYHHFICGWEERPDKWETQYNSQLSTTKCPKCGNLQHVKIGLEDLKNLNSPTLTEREVFEIYLQDKKKIKIKRIDEDIEFEKEALIACQRRINSLTETRDFSIKKRDSIEGNVYFKNDYITLNRNIEECERSISLNEKGVIKHNGKITELHNEKLKIVLDFK